MEIKKIEELITPLLKDGRKFKSSDVKMLLAPGENYGSTMASIKIKLVNKEGKEEDISCVGKLVPPSEFIWKMFNTSQTFKKEIGIYNIVIPTLNAFGRSHNIQELLPFFAECVGSRISLNPASKTVDHEAAIILRDLKADGYKICDRFIGFDEDTAKLLLKDLAVMHATVIAYKLQHPTEFQEVIRPFLNREMFPEFADDVIKKCMEQMVDGLKRDEDCVALLPRVTKKFETMKNTMFKQVKPREPFATMVHMDFWTNNVMLKFEEDQPLASKFVDFQCVEYQNPAMDVVFMIYSSVQLEYLSKVDEFFEYYYENFISTLKTLDCDISQFSFEAFQDEITHAAVDMEFGHVIFMLQPLFTMRGKAKNLGDMKDERDILIENESLHENYYPRLQFIIKDFARHNWI